jgi:hypothetical protein
MEGMTFGNYRLTGMYRINTIKKIHKIVSASHHVSEEIHVRLGLGNFSFATSLRDGGCVTRAMRTSVREGCPNGAWLRMGIEDGVGERGRP